MAVAGALVLARLGAGLRRQRHAELGADLGQDLADAQLVRGIGVGMDQRHRHRLDVERLQALGDPAHGALVEGKAHGAVHVHALRHREAQLARHQRLRLDDVDVVLVEAALVGDLDDVAEAVGGDQRGARALALDDGVGGKRGAVHQHADVGEGEACGGQHGARAVDDGRLRRLRRRQHLGDEAALPGQQHDVGEGAADIDRQPRRRMPLAHDLVAPMRVSDPLGLIPLRRPR